MPNDTAAPTADETLRELKRECRYHENPEGSGEPEQDWAELGSIETLIAYKDALEDLVYRLFGEVAETPLERLARDLARNDAQIWENLPGEAKAHYMSAALEQQQAEAG